MFFRGDLPVVDDTAARTPSFGRNDIFTIQREHIEFKFKRYLDHLAG
jgi:hypothetical protein